MKLNIGFTLLFIMILLGGSSKVLAGPPQATSPQALYEQSLRLTQQGKYGPALGLLAKAKHLYSQTGNSEAVYRCTVLEYVVKFEKQTLATRGKNRPQEWMRSGWLLKDFNYSGSYVIPPVPSKSYQGVVLLTRKVRDIPQGPGRSTPIWGVLAAKSIPRLSPGEEFMGGHCELKGKTYDPEIVAIVRTKGQENKEKFTQVRKAWRLNSRTGKITEIPNHQVVCVNESIGV